MFKDELDEQVFSIVLLFGFILGIPVKIFADTFSDINNLFFSYFFTSLVSSMCICGLCILVLAIINTIRFIRYFIW